MLLGDGGLDSGGTCDDAEEHDAMTASLGQQIAELDKQARSLAAEQGRIEAQVALITAELKQRQAAQMRASSDVQATLVDLVEQHT